jgi:hypothetical protein
VCLTLGVAPADPGPVPLQHRPVRRVSSLLLRPDANATRAKMREQVLLLGCEWRRVSSFKQRAVVSGGIAPRRTCAARGGAWDAVGPWACITSSVLSAGGRTRSAWYHADGRFWMDREAVCLMREMRTLAGTRPGGATRRSTATACRSSRPTGITTSSTWPTLRAHPIPVRLRGWGARGQSDMSCGSRLCARHPGRY